MFVWSWKHKALRCFYLNGCHKAFDWGPPWKMSAVVRLSKTTKIYWSKLWGINYTSCLLQIADFNLILGLVQDPMHIILEGVAVSSWLTTHSQSPHLCKEVFQPSIPELMHSWIPIFIAIIYMHMQNLLLWKRNNSQLRRCITWSIFYRKWNSLGHFDISGAWGLKAKMVSLLKTVQKIQKSATDTRKKASTSHCF